PARAAARPRPGKPAGGGGAAEPANYYDLAALEGGLELVPRGGVETVADHNHRLIEQLFARLPKARCLPASPLDRADRGPYGCFQARSPEKTKELYERLLAENVIVSLRERKIRVSPHLYNTERDIDHLIKVITN